MKLKGVHGCLGLFIVSERIVVIDILLHRTFAHDTHFLYSTMELIFVIIRTNVPFTK